MKMPTTNIMMFVGTQYHTVGMAGW